VRKKKHERKLSRKGEEGGKNYNTQVVLHGRIANTGGEREWFKAASGVTQGLRKNLQV